MKKTSNCLLIVRERDPTLSPSKVFDCTGDDYIDEIEEWNAKRQKIRDESTIQTKKKDELDKALEEKDNEGKRLLALWKDDQKEWYTSMANKSDQLAKDEEALVTRMTSLENEGIKLKDTVVKQLETSFNDTLKHNTNLGFIKDFIKEKSGLLTVCNICSLDLSPLLYTPKTIASLSTNCMECGYFLCNKCVLERLHLNSTNIHSIGYKCPHCSFFNCNTIGVHVASMTQEEEVVFNPIASGVSTCKQPHSHGRVLTTSHPSTISHNNNMTEQIDYNTREQQQMRTQCQCPQCVNNNNENNDADNVDDNADSASSEQCSETASLQF